MSRLARILALVALPIAACSEHGVSLGQQEPCTPDGRLATESLRFEGVRPSSCASIGANLLGNAGFEAPSLDDCQSSTFCQFSSEEVPAWSTTSSSGVVELWADGHRGVRAPEGAQFVELDAASPDTLWQDLSLSPGQLLYWSLLHRGRIGVDTMEVRIGAPDSPISQGLISSPEDAWYAYSGLYRMSADEAVTRFALVSRSGVAEGNLVDQVLLAGVTEP
jgi:hypothetical protein